MRCRLLPGAWGPHLGHPSISACVCLCWKESLKILCLERSLLVCCFVNELNCGFRKGTSKS